MSIGQRYTTVVSAGARRQNIEQLTPTSWHICVTDAAHADAANFAVQKILASVLSVPANRLMLQTGRKSKTKTWKLC
jgi:uncharacterized protein YggU (UPF0235/DUF167 family)